MNNEVKIKKIIILGGQGDGAGIASFINDMQKDGQHIELLGFLNDSDDKRVLNFPVLGSLSSWKNYEKDEDVYFITALLKTKHSYQRSKLINDLKIPIKKYCNVIHPTATISDYSKIGVGNVIGPNVNIMQIPSDTHFLQSGRKLKPEECLPKIIIIIKSNLISLIARRLFSISHFKTH